MTTNWHPYRWVCDNCGAIHYYNPENCRRCGGGPLVRGVNNEKAAKAFEALEQQKQEEAKKKAEQEANPEPQDLRQPIHDEEDDNDPLDGLINDILNG